MTAIASEHAATAGQPWMPYSPCAAPGCLPARRRTIVLAPLAVLRLAGALLLLLAAVPLALGYPFLGTDARGWVIRHWCSAVLWTFGVKLAVEPAPGASTATALVVANHISWLDILALGAVRPGRMVARADMRSWPILGPVAARAGTIFLDRTRLSRLPVTVAEVRAALDSGATVLAFPEGTTWCGAAGGRFRPALFQAAVDAGVPIEPISLRYLAAGRTSTVPAFVGDDALVASMWRVARARGLVAEVRRHPALPPTTDRRTLASQAGHLVHGF